MPLPSVSHVASSALAQAVLRHCAPGSLPEGRGCPDTADAEVRRLYKEHGNAGMCDWVRYDLRCTPLLHRFGYTGIDGSVYSMSLRDVLFGRRLASSEK